MKRTLEQANRPVYLSGYVAISFPYGLEPRLLFGDSVIVIDRPDRFGSWNTRKERWGFVDAFVASA